MPNATLNAVTFTGRPGDHTARTAPKKATRNPYKVGVVHTGADGTLNVMLGNGGDPRNVFTLEWENVGPVTRTAVQAAFALASDFPYVDEDGTTWTVQCLLDDYEEEHVESIPNAGAVMKLYNITLTMRE
jgi:hypothetical protein